MLLVNKYSWQIFMYIQFFKCCLLTNVQGKYSWQILMDIQRYSRGCVWHHPAPPQLINRPTNPRCRNSQILAVEIHKSRIWKSTNPDNVSAQMLIVENFHKTWQWKIGTKTQLGLSCPIVLASLSFLFQSHTKMGQTEFCSQTPQSYNCPQLVSQSGFPSKDMSKSPE